jgi:tetratricopeptide (TPR) repeat protein
MAFMFPKWKPTRAEDLPPLPSLILTPQIVQRDEAALKPPVRLNIRGAIILGIVVAVAILLYFPLSWLQGIRLQRSAMAQATKFVNEGQVDLAAFHLSHYLESWPDDVPALELLAKILTGSAHAPEELLQAANVLDQLLRIDPSGKGRQENRRQLVELYIRYGDIVRIYSENFELAVDKYDGRYRAAVKVAQQRIALGANEAADYRLLGTAYEALSNGGEAKAATDAAIAYEQALRRDPADIVSAERLAYIDLRKRNDQAGADEILEELLAAKPGSVEVRLLRHRYFLNSHREERAAAELQAAALLAPGDLSVQVAMAGESIRQNDLVRARKQLDAIPPDQRDDRRVRVLRGLIELGEAQPEVAINDWRKGLENAGGADLELTWRLAQVLIRLGRLGEARPLVNQFQRLIGSDAHPMSRLLTAWFEERKGHPARAVAELEAAKVKMGLGMLSEVQQTLGRCHEALGDIERAKIDYRQALIASPWSSTPRLALARLLAVEHPAKAAEELESGLRVVPNDMALLSQLANLYLNEQLSRPESQRNWSDVESVVYRIEQVPVKDPRIDSIRATYLLASGRDKEGFAKFEAAVSGAGKTRDDLWLAWANGLVSKGRVPEAIALLDRAAKPEAAGDLASFRVAKARLLLRTGHGRAAIAELGADSEARPMADRQALAKARAQTWLELGDREQTAKACVEWAKIAPDDPQPGLLLLALGQDGDESMAQAGLDVLRSVGGEDEPYGLAARAFDLIFSKRIREETRSSRIEQADALIKRLQELAPHLPVGHYLRGSLYERSHRVEDAIGSYRLALRGDTAQLSLRRLVELLTKLNRTGELASLKRETGLATRIDRIAASVSLDGGDKAKAEKIVAGLVETEPDSVEIRALHARLLQSFGRSKDAEATLLDLVARQPDQADSWLSLVSFEAAQGMKDVAIKNIERAALTYKGPRMELLLGRLYWLAGERETAVKILLDATNRYPDHLETLRVTSECLEASGKLAETDSLLRRVMLLDSSARWATRRLANLLANRRDPAAWSEAWSLLSSIPGDYPEDRLAKAAVLARSNEPRQKAASRQMLGQLIADLPQTDRVATEARIRLARAELDADRPLEAAQAIAPVADDPGPPNPSAIALAAESFARAGKLDEATRQLGRLITVAPTMPAIASTRAWMSKQQGKPLEAAAAIEEAIAKYESSPNAELISVAFLDQLFKLQLDDAVERVARKIATRWPRDGWILARFLVTKGKVAEAIDACKTTIDAGSLRESTQVLTRLAIDHRLDPAQLAQVGELTRLATTKARDDTELTLLHATIRHFQGKFDDEVACYRKVLEREPNNSVVLHNLAWTLSEGMNRPAEALALVDQALKKAPENPRFRETRGVILMRLGRLDEATADLEAGVKANPTALGYFHLAAAHRKANRPDDRKKYRELALQAKLNQAELDPGDRSDFATVMAP